MRDLRAGCVYRLSPGIFFQAVIAMECQSSRRSRSPRRAGLLRCIRACFSWSFVPLSASSAIVTERAGLGQTGFGLNPDQRRAFIGAGEGGFGQTM